MPIEGLKEMIKPARLAIVRVETPNILHQIYLIRTMTLFMRLSGISKLPSAKFLCTAVNQAKQDNEKLPFSLLTIKPAEIKSD